MNELAMAMFAFVTGATVAGLSASLMQLATDRRIGFIEPFVSQHLLARSLLATVAAGPMMLGNGALDAWREGRASWLLLATACGLAVLWVTATGVVVLEVASRIHSP